MSKTFAVLAALMALFFSIELIAAPPAEWGFQKLPAAMEEATASNKPVFVLFGFEGCPGCRKLYSDTLSDKKLRETFQKNFVLAYVDTTGLGEPASYQISDGPALSHDELMSKFKGSPTPSWVFLTSKGIKLHGDRGGKTMVHELMRDGKTALDKFNASATGG